MYARDVYVVNNRGSFQCHVLIVLEIKKLPGDEASYIIIVII